MATDPYQVLMDECPSLVKDALGNNDHVGEFLYVVLAEVVAHAAKNRLDVRGITPEVILSGGDQIRIRLEYREVGTDYVEQRVLWRRNPEMAQVMLVNPNVKALAGDLINVLMGWANSREVPLAEVIVRNVMVPRGGGVIVADLITLRDFNYEMEGQLT